MHVGDLLEGAPFEPWGDRVAEHGQGPGGIATEPAVSSSKREPYAQVGVGGVRDRDCHQSGHVRLQPDVERGALAANVAPRDRQRENRYQEAAGSERPCDLVGILRHLLANDSLQTMRIDGSAALVVGGVLLLSSSGDKSVPPPQGSLGGVGLASFR